MKRECSSKPKFELSKKVRVGVLYGGNSSERKISIRSGRAVNTALRRIGFQTVVLDPASPRFAKALSQIDLAFIALHGRGGEDGTIQKTLERRKIPYVGAGPKGSWAAFDKSVSKRIFEKEGIPTSPYRVVGLANHKTRLKRFPAPFFVKPICEGSSVGAFSVEDFSKSAVKIHRAVRRYGRLLVEKKIEGPEYTVGILDKSPLPVIELRPKRSFYDFRAKYTKGMTEYLVPAPIAAGLAKRLQRIALRAHRALGLRDLSRVDLMLDRDARPFVLEVNSIPGFTELSLLPKAARAAGISFEGLCYRLVAMAYRRHNHQGR